MKKSLSEMVWPQVDYTNIIHAAVREIFHGSPLITFTYSQLRDQLSRKFDWLKLDTEQQKQLLHRIVNTAIKKYIQLNLIKQVTSKTSVERQWIWAQLVDKTGYRNLTTSLEVATNEEAIAKCLNRAVSEKSLRKLNEATATVTS